MEEAARLLNDVEYCKDAYETLDVADGVAILTEWNEFRALDLEKVRVVMNRPLMVDLRNVYKPQEMAAAGFEYLSIGRPAQRPAPEAARRPFLIAEGN